ncbi:MAG: PaaI family thioesterase [Actinomycetota bacterium]
MHGGVSLAICDEAMAWAAIATHRKWAVTRDLSAHFDRPVQVGTAYRCEARINGGDGDALEGEAMILDESGKTHVRATATLVIYAAVHAPDLIGGGIPDAFRSYLRET